MSVEKTFALLKPDCLKRGLAPLFLSEIKALGLTIEARQTLHLTRDMARLIYRDVVDMHFYVDLEGFMLSGLCMMLVISGDDAINKVVELKHRFRKEHSASWINLTQEEIELWEIGKHPRQQELNLKLTATNLAHTADTEMEAMEVIKFITVHT